MNAYNLKTARYKVEICGELAEPPRAFSVRLNMSQPRLMLLLVGGLLLFAFTPKSIHAQTIRGTVVDSATGVAVGRGFVALLDGSGAEVSRMLTSREGEFQFVLRGPGTFSLRSERIAYRVAQLGLGLVEAGEVRTVSLLAPAIPLRLDAIEFESETQCRMSPADGRNTAALWEEATKALRAASWSAENDIYVHTLHHYERGLDIRRRLVESEQTTVRTGNFRAPFRSIPPEELFEKGYIFDDGGGAWYNAPDANTLLHDTFVATHCFRVTRDRDHETMIGLGFEPVSDRELPDIKGVLWLDQESWELRQIDYTYTRVPNRIRDERVGGMIEFLVMPSGAWIVSKFQIRKPQLVRYEDRRGRVGSAELGGFQDSGGNVTRIETRGGELLYESPDLVTITGTVYDSAASRTLGGAQVEVVGTGYSATTGPLGGFEISALLDGEYQMSFDHIRLDSLGFAATPTEIELRPGQRVDVDLFVPSEESVLRFLCPASPGNARTRTLVGTVRNPTNGRGVADAVILARWQNISMTGDAFRGVGEAAGTQSDVWGNYVLCDLPKDALIEIEATQDSVNFGIASVRFSDGRAETMDAISMQLPLTAYYMQGSIWSLDLPLFPPACIDRRRLSGSMMMEVVVTCEAPSTPRRRRRN
jgi:hypothetical protein